MTGSAARGEVRTARATRTRDAIVDAARDLFVRRGYRATSLRDIATAAGISHPGLLRHFATKDELLAEIVEQFEADNAELFLERLPAEADESLGYAEIARHNEEVPGYLPLFAALMGEASTASHPAHDRMRARYARLIELSAEALDDAMARNVVAPDRDARGEARRLAAAWDGLQLIEQYLPDRVDVATALERHEAQLALPLGWREPGAREPRETAAVPAMPELSGPEPADDAGYRRGRERRARIVADALALFAAEGYGDTSLRDIAEKVGVSKSTLLHHYPSKEELLSAVLSERDRRIGSRPSYVHQDRAAAELRLLPLGAAENSANEPGLIEVYAVLSCEAVPADHPAHGYFADRFARVIDHFALLLRAAQEDGDLPAHRDPEVEAVWLVALWDGLQCQWLYDRSGVDVAAELTAHLDDLLPRG